MRKLCRNWLRSVPSMSVPIAGTVAVRHVSNRSAQNPAVHRASASPTGPTAACGDCPAAGGAQQAARSTANTGRGTSALLLPGLRPRHGDVELVPPVLHLE